MMRLKKLFDDLNDQYNDVKSMAETNNCWKLSLTLQEIDGILNQHIQTITKDQLANVLRKLRMNAPLTSEELAYVKLRLVGDAQYYTHWDDHYQEWLANLEKTMAAINDVNINTKDFQELTQLRALTLDAVRILSDMTFYLKQKQRVDNFMNTTQELTEAERFLLINLLEGQKDLQNA